MFMQAILLILAVCGNTLAFLPNTIFRRQPLTIAPLFATSASSPSSSKKKKNKFSRVADSKKVLAKSVKKVKLANKKIKKKVSSSSVVRMVKKNDKRLRASRSEKHGSNTLHNPHLHRYQIPEPLNRKSQIPNPKHYKSQVQNVNAKMKPKMQWPQHSSSSSFSCSSVKI